MQLGDSKTQMCPLCSGCVRHLCWHVKLQSEIDFRPRSIIGHCQYRLIIAILIIAILIIASLIIAQCEQSS